MNTASANRSRENHASPVIPRGRVVISLGAEERRGGHGLHSGRKQG
jgi:hypothetical protein